MKKVWFFCIQWGLSLSLQAGIDNESIGWEYHNPPRFNRHLPHTDADISTLYHSELGDNPEEVQESVLWHHPHDKVRVTLFYGPRYTPEAKVIYIHMACHGRHWIKTFLKLDDRFKREEGPMAHFQKALGMSNPVNILSLRWIVEAMKDTSQPQWVRDLLLTPHEFNWKRVLSYHRSPESVTFYRIFDQWRFSKHPSEELPLKAWHFINSRDHFYDFQAQQERKVLFGDYESFQKLTSRFAISEVFFPEKSRAEEKVIEKGQQEYGERRLERILRNVKKEIEIERSQESLP